MSVKYKRDGLLGYFPKDDSDHYYCYNTLIIL